MWLRKKRNRLTSLNQYSRQGQTAYDWVTWHLSVNSSHQADLIRTVTFLFFWTIQSIKKTVNCLIETYSMFKNCILNLVVVFKVLAAVMDGEDVVWFGRKRFYLKMIHLPVDQSVQCQPYHRLIFVGQYFVLFFQMMRVSWKVKNFLICRTESPPLSLSTTSLTFLSSCSSLAQPKCYFTWLLLSSVTCNFKCK